MRPLQQGKRREPLTPDQRREPFSGGPAYLVADRPVTGDGLAGRAGGSRINVREQFGGRQPHLIGDPLVASDGGKGVNRGVRVVFG